MVMTEEKQEIDSNVRIKKRLRKIVARISSYMEILISILILMGILVTTLNLGIELIGLSKESFLASEVMVPLEKYLASSLQLIIGVEFVKMISKHTVGSTIDVLLFAIARKLVVSHGGSLDLLLGIIGIAILFIVKHYFGNKCEHCPIEPRTLTKRKIDK